MMVMVVNGKDNQRTPCNRVSGPYLDSNNLHNNSPQPAKMAYTPPN